jgi:hypothetical protein
LWAAAGGSAGGGQDWAGEFTTGGQGGKVAAFKGKCVLLYQTRRLLWGVWGCALRHALVLPPRVIPSTPARPQSIHGCWPETSVCVSVSHCFGPKQYCMCYKKRWWRRWLYLHLGRRGHARQAAGRPVPQPRVKSHAQASQTTVGGRRPSLTAAAACQAAGRGTRAGACPAAACPGGACRGSPAAGTRLAARNPWGAGLGVQQGGGRGGGDRKG